MHKDLAPHPASRLAAQLSAALRRSHRQSHALTLVLAAVFALLTPLAVLARSSPEDRSLLVGAVTFSILFAAAVLVLHAATPPGALAGAAICLVLILGSSSSLPQPLLPQLLHSALTPLVLLFVLTFLATRAGGRRKHAAGLAESSRGRQASQVFANLSVPALCVALPAIRATAASSPGDRIVHLASVAALAALAEATADTVSSEVGQASGGTPRLLLGLQPVPVGTDGAISIVGTAAGLAACAVLTLSGFVALHLHPRQAFIAFVAGAAGLFFDSFLGCTLERRGFLGNDLVNLASGIFAAVLAAGLAP